MEHNLQMNEDSAIAATFATMDVMILFQEEEEISFAAAIEIAEKTHQEERDADLYWWTTIVHKNWSGQYGQQGYVTLATPFPPSYFVCFLLTLRQIFVSVCFG